MTRREEITRKALELDTTNDIATFVVAARWADKTMIEKACDWIQCMGIDYIQGDITDVKWESMFADLRNYIENGDD